MPQTTGTKRNRVDGSLRGLLALAVALLLAVAAFVAVYSYMDKQAAIAQAQAAAAAEAQKIADAFDGVHLEARAAIVVDLATGKTLYEMNPDAQLPLASLTKVAMALSVSEVLDPTDVIRIPYDTAPAGSPPMQLRKGERWSVRDVMDYTLIASSNEGADILAMLANDALHQKYPLSPAEGPYEATLWRMNDLAHQLKLTQTYFRNVNGLDLSTTTSGAYGSARNMATLFAYAASSAPQIFGGTTKNDLLLTDEAGESSSAYNTNEALGAIPGLILGKTGFTDLAGGNLAVVFDVGLAHPVVAVVLGSSHDGRFSDMKALVSATRKAIADN